VENKRRRLIEESVIQPMEIRIDPAVPSLPNAQFLLILHIVSLLEVHQLQKLSVALFILGILCHVKLLHLGVILRRELLLLLGQLLLKL
jgi:hypothetical protein